MIEIRKKLNLPAAARKAYGVQVKGRLALTLELRRNPRARIKPGSGDEVVLMLPPDAVLGSGDLVVAADGSVIEVIAAPEPVLHVTCDSSEDLTRAAYHLGHRHVPVQVGEGHLRIPADPVLEELLKALGAKVEATEAPFEPEAEVDSARMQMPGHGKEGHGHQHAHGHAAAEHVHGPACGRVHGSQHGHGPAHEAHAHHEHGHEDHDHAHARPAARPISIPVKSAPAHVHGPDCGHAHAHDHAHGAHAHPEPHDHQPGHHHAHGHQHGDGESHAGRIFYYSETHAGNNHHGHGHGPHDHDHGHKH